MPAKRTLRLVTPAVENRAVAPIRRPNADYKLAGDGHDTRSIQAYLGHSDIRHTVRYTELSPKPFRDFWR